MSESGRFPHIAVVGDVILDRYLIGDATRRNPEASGFVIRVEREDDRLGGAAAVAMIAARLVAQVTLAGVLGRDEPGDRLLALLDAHDIATHVLRDDRPTTWKQRVVAGGIQPDRHDREDARWLTDEAVDFLADVPIGNVLFIQDYGKGVCPKQLVSKLA